MQLEEFLDSGLANTSGSEQLVRDHIQAVQAWGFDFEWMCEIPEQLSCRLAQPLFPQAKRFTRGVCRYKHPAAKYNETTPDVTDFHEAFPETGRVGCHDPDCCPAYAPGSWEISGLCSSDDLRGSGVWTGR